MSTSIKLLGNPAMVFNDYKKTALYFPVGLTCTFKCMSDLVSEGYNISNCNCHNSHLCSVEPTEYSPDAIKGLILRNPFVEAIVLAGLEPLDTMDNTIALIEAVRDSFDYDIVVYTGYNPDEMVAQVELLKKYDNIIVKYGRFDPRVPKRYDEVMGVELPTGNQFAVKIS